MTRHAVLTAILVPNVQYQPSKAPAVQGVEWVRERGSHYGATSILHHRERKRYALHHSSMRVYESDRVLAPVPKSKANRALKTEILPEKKPLI